LKTPREVLELEATYSELTPAEIAEPVKLESWPSPPGMLTGKDAYGVPWVSAERRAVLQCYHDDSYGSDSRVVHQKNRALYISMLQAKGLTREERYARKASVFRAATLYAAMVTEVGHELGWSKEAKRSSSVELPDSGLGSCTRSYRIRYRTLLACR
jgi:hypothetical protein